METTILTGFEKDIIAGLSGSIKSLSSKYFYDEQGDKIFQSIMDMPEYYLTQSEFEIFSEQKSEILRAFSSGNESFNLIELGAGDGKKTKVLLEYFLDSGVDFTYYPVDISPYILAELDLDLKTSLPEVEVDPLNLDYFEALITLRKMNDRRNIILLLGSNIGNFNKADATHFLSQLSAVCQTGDMLLIGVDLKKDPRIIQRAYDDPGKITASFNLNLLTRINREMSADFNTEKFEHYAFYNPENGEVRSYLISKEKQSVTLRNYNLKIKFNENEYIHTEISKKYSPKELEHLAGNSGFKLIKNFTDAKNYFVDSLWEII